MINSMDSREKIMGFGERGQHNAAPFMHTALNERPPNLVIA
jgi:hypothetical protein